MNNNKLLLSVTLCVPLITDAGRIDQRFKLPDPKSTTQPFMFPLQEQLSPDQADNIKFTLKEFFQRVTLMKNIILTFLIAVITVGCQSYPQAYQAYTSQDSPRKNAILPTENAFVKPLDLKELPDTIRTEHQDRVNRLTRLSHQFGIQPPTQQDLQVAPNTVSGIAYPVPVTRIRYGERTFFDSDKADILPESSKILDVMAEQMNRDLPDTSLVMLGHTDSVGTDEYNNQLSLRRAAAVMNELAKRGVNTEQMSTVAIGESQPIATNATEDGRALNRRVEFMLSRFAEANYVAIEQFPRHSQWLNNHAEEQPNITPVIKPPKKLVVLKLSKKPSVILPIEPNQTVAPPDNKTQVIIPPSAPVIQTLQETDRIVTLLPPDEKTTRELLPD